MALLFRRTQIFARTRLHTKQPTLIASAVDMVCHRTSLCLPNTHCTIVMNIDHISVEFVSSYIRPHAFSILFFLSTSCCCHRRILFSIPFHFIIQNHKLQFSRAHHHHHHHISPSTSLINRAMDIWKMRKIKREITHVNSKVSNSFYRSFMNERMKKWTEKEKDEDREKDRKRRSHSIYVRRLSLVIGRLLFFILSSQFVRPCAVVFRWRLLIVTHLL